MAAPVSPLQSLLSGEPLPTLPKFQKDWSLQRVVHEQQRCNQQMLDYIRRLMGRFNGVTIVQEIITTVEGTPVTVLAGWQYNGTSHQFEYKTQVIKVLSFDPASAYTAAAGTQPTQVTGLVDWQYNAANHQFEYKTRAAYVLSPGAVSGFSATGGTQPSSVTVVSDWQYNTTTHKFQKNSFTGYALEAGSLSGLANTTGGQPVQADFIVQSVDFDLTTHELTQTRNTPNFVLELGESVTSDIDVAVPCSGTGSTIMAAQVMHSSGATTEDMLTLHQNELTAAMLQYLQQFDTGE